MDLLFDYYCSGEYNDYIYITTDTDITRSFIAAIINVFREERTLV